MKQLHCFRQNIIYTRPFWKCWHTKEFGCNVLLVILLCKALWCNTPYRINCFYIRINHFTINTINAFFDVGVCCPIIFWITFFITGFKIFFQVKLLGKMIVEARRQKLAYVHFMVIPRFTLFTNLISVDSRKISLSNNSDKHPSHSSFNRGLCALEFNRMTHHDVTPHHQQGGPLKEDGFCWCNGPKYDPSTTYTKEDGPNLIDGNYRVITLFSLW